MICSKQECTACGACRDACPQECISLLEDELGALYPHINPLKCVKCGLCKTICPAEQKKNFHRTQAVYVAWSESERYSSASGGVASELYRYYLSQGWMCYGVIINRECCKYVRMQMDDIGDVKNSKYVYSDTAGVYKDIKNYLALGKRVLFIGLPCQVQGLYSFIRNPNDLLVTVDIICHGVTPFRYLEEHISQIEKRHNTQAKKISFRDPEFSTSSFVFSLRNSKKLFYNKSVDSSDVYQLGYHHFLTYRENCYHCIYAKQERVGDITIGDFSGLGRLNSFNFPRENISCVLINTQVGESMIKSVKSIEMHERPMGEAFNYEKQLNRPSEPHPSRKIFEELYRKNVGFSKAASVALREDINYVRFHKAFFERVRNKFIRIIKKIFNLA